MFSARLRKSLLDNDLDEQALMHGSYTEVLSAWANTVTTSVAQVEFAHGRNRRRSHQVEHWGHFVGKTINEEAKLTLATHIDNFIGRPQGRQQRGPKRVRKASVHDLFHREFCKARKISGQTCNLKDPVFWEEERRALEAVSPEMLEHLQLESSLSESAEQRRQRALDAPPAAPAAPSVAVQRPADDAPGLQLVAAEAPESLSLLPALPAERLHITGIEELMVNIDPKVDDTPMSADQLANAMKSDCGKYKPMEGVYSDFVKTQTHIASQWRAIGNYHYPRRGRWQAFPVDGSGRRYHAYVAKAIVDLASSRGIACAHPAHTRDAR